MTVDKSCHIHCIYGEKRNNTESPEEESCAYPSLECDADRKCVGVLGLCDGVRDCADGADEGIRCGERLCEHGGDDCSDRCRNSPDGRRCHCPNGLHLRSDNRTCSEDHPCDRWGTCSQLCKKVSSFIQSIVVHSSNCTTLSQVSRKRHKCHCHEDFYLAADGFTCKSKFERAPPPLLVFTTGSEMRSIDLRSGIARTLISRHVL